MHFMTNFSGGGNIAVFGKNLDSVQQPKLMVHLPETGEVFTEVM